MHSTQQGYHAESFRTNVTGQRCGGTRHKCFKTTVNYRYKYTLLVSISLKRLFKNV